jgi:hypothetical protein
VSRPVQDSEQQAAAGGNVARAVIMLLAELPADDLVCVRQAVLARLQALGHAD